MAEHRLGETIAASTTSMTTECYKGHERLALGLLIHVAVGDGRVFGIVNMISNVPIDPSRRPAARGQNVEDEAELRRAHPELLRLARTEFEAILVGFQSGSGSEIHHGYPPRPAGLHSFVYLTDTDTTRLFMKDVSFVDLVVGAVPNPALADQVAADAVNQLATLADDPKSFRRDCGKRLARLFNRDLIRLDSLLLRIAGP